MDRSTTGEYRNAKTASRSSAVRVAMLQDKVTLPPITGTNLAVTTKSVLK